MGRQEFHFKKKYGQNFIREDSIVEKIKEVSNIYDHSLIIEIGPGGGALTKKLASTKNQVLAYEIDLDLKDLLEKSFSEFGNVEFIFDDFMKRNVVEDIQKYSYDFLYVVANLPYYITTPIIEKVIQELEIDRMVIMVQKEVADRFCANPNTKEYNSLTIFLQSYFDVKFEFFVSRNCFIPKPNVDSAVVSFSKKKNPYFILDRNHFEKLVRDSFQFKRKTLRNNLKNYNLNLIEQVLLKYGHDLNNRAETIEIKEFIEISNELQKCA